MLKCSDVVEILAISPHILALKLNQMRSFHIKLSLPFKFDTRLTAVKKLGTCYILPTYCNKLFNTSRAAGFHTTVENPSIQALRQVRND